MAKLLTYKRRDNNKYSTFNNKYRTFNNMSFEANNDNLELRTMTNHKKLAMCVYPAVHKKYENRSQNKKPQKGKRWISWTCFYDRKLISRMLCYPCLFCISACRKRNTGNSNRNDDIDKAVEEYEQQQGVAILGRARSTVQSKKDAGCFWSWDESWKSNSDKFLESLELDDVGSDNSLTRKLRQNSKVRITAFGRFQGWGCSTHRGLSMILLKVSLHLRKYHLEVNAKLIKKIINLCACRGDASPGQCNLSGSWKHKFNSCNYNTANNITNISGRSLASTVRRRH